MTTEKTVRDAISRSISHNESVRVEVEGGEDGLHEAVSATWMEEWDYVQENDGTYDVWGWTEKTPEGQQEWRLSVVLS